jgi:DNA polymerase bacteriophage-type
MAAEVLEFAQNGEKIGALFSDTFKRCKVGINRIWKWIERTITKATPPEILGLSLNEKTLKTEELCKPSTQSALVYDLLSCGPKNRFMIWSEDGPLIVHNCELALQYYGGVGAFCAMAETYGVRLDELAVAAWPVLPLATRREAQALWSKAIKRRRTYGLPERTWVVCQALVLLWRAAHPQIVAFWEAIDDAVKSAIKAPSKRFRVGDHIEVDRKGNWLRIRLPSGRYLNYPAPRIRTDGRFTTRSFIGVNPYTRQWGRIKTYSGKDAENICQGGCADLLMDGLLAADDAGYNPVLSVHDEVIADSPTSKRYSDKGLSKLLISSSPWAKGMPLAAKGKTSDRYAK